jgi:hypothetical protein
MILWPYIEVINLSSFKQKTIDRRIPYPMYPTSMVGWILNPPSYMREVPQGYKAIGEVIISLRIPIIFKTSQHSAT